VDFLLLTLQWPSLYRWVYWVTIAVLELVAKHLPKISVKFLPVMTSEIRNQYALKCEVVTIETQINNVLFCQINIWLLE